MASARTIIHLACDSCKRRNYTARKNRQLHQERVAYKKYCSWCRTHTEHKETR